MRVIGGEHKGRSLKTLSGFSTRPTLDKVRGAVFNALYDVSQASVLDLFGGSGAMALEALSRGAASAVIVDNSKAAIEIIKKNVEDLGYNSKVDLRLGEFSTSLRKEETFDLIFLDPPYNTGLLIASFRLINDLRLLSVRGIIVAETGADSPEYAEDSCFTLIKEKQYGTTKILYYRFNEE